MDAMPSRENISHTHSHSELKMTTDISPHFRAFRFGVKKKKKRQEWRGYHTAEVCVTPKHCISLSKMTRTTTRQIKKPEEEFNCSSRQSVNTILQAFHCKKRYRTDVTSPFLSAFLFFYACHGFAFPPNNCWMAFLEDELHHRLHNVRLKSISFPDPTFLPTKGGQSFHMTGIHSLTGFVTVSKRGQSHKKRHRNTSPTPRDRHVT